MKPYFIRIIMTVTTLAAVNVADFKVFFPEFVALDDTLLGNMLNMVCIITNEYKGIAAGCDQNKQYLAIYLYLAHQLKLSSLVDSTGGTTDCVGGIKKKVKSKNDEIEFDTSSLAKMDFDSTRYGQQLQDIIRLCSTGRGAMNCSCC